ncbi:membrane hypothetical protein [Gammaproteobacteria bacterium]
MSFVMGLVFTAFANVAVVFERRLSPASVASYACYYLGYYAVNLLGLSLVIEIAYMPSHLGPLFVLPITVPLHYVMSRTLLARFQGRN